MEASVGVRVGWVLLLPLVGCGEPAGVPTSARALGVVASGWIAPGDEAGAELGAAVAPAGDVDGDGFGDLLVGEPGWGPDGEGRAQLWFGSTTGPAVAADWDTSGDSPGAGLGTALAGLGDVNGDGFGDLVVGAPGAGTVDLYCGSATGPGDEPDWTATTADSELGAALAWAGDVNRDGFADLVVGAPTFTGAEVGEGAVFLWLGGPEGLALDADWSVAGGQPGAALGSAVAGVFDVNGDGYSDIAAGAPGWNAGVGGEGAAFVWLGAEDGPAVEADWTREGLLEDDALGSAIAGVGDSNADGYADLVVGAPGDDTGGTDAGAIELLVGSVVGPFDVAVWTAHGDQDDEALGSALAAAGDLDGNGFGDLVAGAPGYSYPQSGEGAVRVWYGSGSALLVEASAEFEGDEVGAALGRAVAGVGDVNGDGFADLVAGAPGASPASVAGTGEARLYYGAASPPSEAPAWDFVGSFTGGQFGAAVGFVGDLDADGFEDVAFGEPSASCYCCSSCGRIWVFEGSADGLPAAASHSWNRNGAGLGGKKLDGAGDVDADGYSEFVYAIPWGHQGQLFHGQEGGLGIGVRTSYNQPTADWAFQTDSYYGTAFQVLAASTAGDVNGDGYDDVLLGLTWGTTSESGIAIGFYGSATGLPDEPDWEVFGATPDAFFGDEVQNIGDVDGDGYDDVLVGAYQWDGSSGDEGKAWIYSGGPSGLSTVSSWEREGAAGMSFGMGAAGIGDVNGDGIDDFAVGTYFGNYVEVYYGRFFLGPELTPDLVLNAPAGASGFGSVVGVASAGDINADGFGDLLIGAQWTTNPDSAEGAIFVFLGSSSGLDTTPFFEAESDQAGAELGEAAAGGGDVNGDGFPDLLIGAPGWPTANGTGAGLLYSGGAGETGTALGGRRLRQVQVTDGLPIAAGLRSEGQSFVVRSDAARSWAGRARVGLSVEVESGIDAFDGTDLQTDATYTDAGVLGAPLQQLQYLLPPLTPHHWRGRIVQDPAQGPLVAASHWMFGGRSGAARGRHLVTSEPEPDSDSDGDPDSTDCDDADPTIHLFAPESCDDVDSDCDGDLVDDSPDLDGDTLPDCVDPDADGDGFEGPVGDDVDCDDLDPSSYPFAAEVPDDGVDQDCSGFDTVSCWLDDDGDGFGAVDAVVELEPNGDCLDADQADNDDDCDDDDPGINPQIPEIPDDGTDWDCDGFDGTACFEDLDGDGVGSGASVISADDACDAAGEASTGDDCDDTDPSIYGGAPEACDDVDSDCDGSLVDEDPDLDTDDLPDCIDADADGDGYDAIAQGGEDCDDLQADAWPGNPEVCDGVDNDCDPSNGEADDVDGDGETLCGGDCDDLDPAVYSASAEACDGRDNDCDGLVPPDEVDGDGDATLACDDCDDDDPSAFPGNPEVCDGVDNDCDGVLPEDEADEDGDASRACEDCDDDDATAFPGNPEVCDGVDNDCDGVLPEDEADEDGDASRACDDCDDDDPAVHADAKEACDGIDNDCDGLVPASEADEDGDGVRPCAGDCDDTEAAAVPGAEEVCDGIDNDCVPGTNEQADSDSDGISICGGDCDDTNGAVFPNHPEACDGLDNDCNPSTDELADGDGDSLSVCGGDCDDTNRNLVEPADCEAAAAPSEPEMPGAPGCTCSSGGALPGSALALLLLVGRRRRRRDGVRLGRS